MTEPIDGGLPAIPARVPQILSDVGPPLTFMDLL